VGQVTWRTGDLVLADPNGAIRIPAPLARDVLRKSRDVGARERSYYEVLDAPDFSVAKLREWVAGHTSIYPKVDPEKAERWWSSQGKRLAPRSEGISE
jgi:hypothetical protein